jgi:hypothetical protein
MAVHRWHFPSCWWPLERGGEAFGAMSALNQVTHMHAVSSNTNRFVVEITTSDRFEEVTERPPREPVEQRNGARDIPRLRCSGQSWSHESAFLTIRTASPLVIDCPICGAVARVEQPAEQPECEPNE